MEWLHDQRALRGEWLHVDRFNRIFKGVAPEVGLRVSAELNPAGCLPPVFNQ
jgi:hypothetical protein